jgi:site-specific recombinase XerD
VTLRSFFQFLEDEDGLVNIMKRMRGRKVPVAPVPILSREDILKMIEAAKKIREPFRSAWDTAMVMVLADAGLRLGELHGLTMEDVELSGDVAVLAVTGKGSKKRVVVVGEKVRMAAAPVLAGAR